MLTKERRRSLNLSKRQSVAGSGAFDECDWFDRLTNRLTNQLRQRLRQ
jgi:hypothetical protein